MLESNNIMYNNKLKSIDAVTGKSSMSKLTEISPHRLKGTLGICLSEVHPQAPMMK
jgi:hypothetical protein